MSHEAFFKESDALAAKLLDVLSIPGYDESPRNRVSYLASSLSLEHWQATQALLREGLLPSALVIHRAQFEALVRAVWIFYAGTKQQIEKLATDLTLDSEQAAKNLPLIAEMMAVLATKAPPQPYEALSRFKNVSWKALNSYAHAGIHPLQRHGQSYPLRLIEQAARNANGLAVIAGMQAAVLTGRQQLVHEIGTLQHSHKNCLPPRSDA